MIIDKVGKAIKTCDNEHTICIIKQDNKFRIYKVKYWNQDRIYRKYNVVKWFSKNGKGSKGYPLDILKDACKGV